ncbi:MAG: KAP family P-loop NTPase fold protein [Thermoleophilia bacterium]
MSVESAPKLPLWDDNPSDIDFLGFDAVAVPILAALESEDLDPLTIGVHAKWGGGKSTILSLIAKSLESKTSSVVIQTNPWAYDDRVDVKGTIIGEVLGALEEKFGATAGVSDKVGGLLKRISWSRAAVVLANGALAKNLDLQELVAALTPKKRTDAESMGGFKAEFDDFIRSLPDVTRVVVLVDDLDRCLPSAVMDTLEAIKLFLSVKRMVFVIAADQDMVRDAIAMNLSASPGAERFAQRYLDKIVQLPVSLPHLPPYESEAYIGLLLARPVCTHSQFEQLLDHCKARREKNRLPLLGEMNDLEFQPPEAILRLASQLAHGLRADKVVNPREIKRFLNAFSVRQQIAQARGLSVRPDVIAKLLLLEDRYRFDFETLASMEDTRRPAILQAWESWAKGERVDRPDGVTEESKGWAASEPSLANETIGSYLTLAASLAVVTATVPMDDELAGILSSLLGASDADRRSAMGQVSARSLGDQRTLLEGLFGRARLSEDVSLIIDAAVGIVDQSPELASEVAAAIRENCWLQLDAGCAAEIANCSHLSSLAKKLVADGSLKADVRQAAREVLETQG